MNRNQIRQTFSLALVFVFAGLGITAQAQRQNTDWQTRQLIRRIDNHTTAFRSTLDAALDTSRIDGTRREDNINAFVSDFVSATNQLRDRAASRQSISADVQNVLDRAALIDRFMRRNRLSGQVNTDWASLRTDLDELARLNNVAWNWDTRNNPSNNYPRNDYPPVGRAGSLLTGTYTLDASRSDDGRAIAERSTRGISVRDRQRSLDSLTARLEAPTTIAIDRRGRSVTIASSRAPQFTFDADGVEREEMGPSGRSMRVRSTLSGDQLIVATTGSRGNDFNVTFEPMEGGRRLRVTRRITDLNLTAPVTVVSVYNKTSDVAQLDINNGGPGYQGNGGYQGPRANEAGSDFIIADGTPIIATLNDNLTTRATRENDRFTMTVRSPSQYQGATINGYVTNVNRSGRITGRSELTLNYETITMRDGRSYRFAGITESIRASNGETVRVDNEGAVRDDNRTTTTEKRAAIGTAVGAIIGAIAGGGKGAAIGAVTGAGAGAGSVYVQGRDDLELMSGTEVTVRASGPR